MEQFKKIDQLIKQGYEFNERRESAKACDVWLSAWEEIKVLMLVDGCQTIGELDKKYEWSDFLANFIQDLEMELHNAGHGNYDYFHKRIKYCSELLKKWETSDRLLVENFHRAIADSHFELGNKQEGERLYEQWLREDPTWGWGYIGYSDNYVFAKDATISQLKQAEDILFKALAQESLRDRVYVVERAAELYELLARNKEKETEIQREEAAASRIEAEASTNEVATKEIAKKEIAAYRKKANDLRLEYKHLEQMENKTLMPLKKTSQQAKNIGRNDPCVCGSGKKYKKCCG